MFVFLYLCFFSFFFFCIVVFSFDSLNAMWHVRRSCIRSHMYETAFQAWSYLPFAGYVRSTTKAFVLALHSYTIQPQYDKYSISTWHISTAQALNKNSKGIVTPLYCSNHMELYLKCEHRYTKRQKTYEMLEMLYVYMYVMPLKVCGIFLNIAGVVVVLVLNSTTKFYFQT